MAGEARDRRPRESGVSYARITAWVCCSVAMLLPGATGAQLVDESQIGPVVPGGAIAKSLEEQVGAGHGSAFEPGSSVYLILRDPARAIRRGRQLFQRKFTAEQGVGPRVNAHSTGDIIDNRAFGAGLMDSCAGCHGRPRGAAGFGGDVVTRPDSRDAPHLFGLGLQEMLADEMTQTLRGIRAEAIERAIGAATSTGAVTTTAVALDESQDRTRPSRFCRRNPAACAGGGSGAGSDDGTYQVNPDGSVTMPLMAKGVRFGRITGMPDGTVDTSEVEGVDADLRVRPFFHHGETVSIREFAIGAFKAEMGLEAPDPILCAVTDPTGGSPQISPSGFVFDPAGDDFERPPVCDTFVDGDGDGVANEVDTALVDFMEFYLLNYFKPGVGKQTRRTQEGKRLLRQIECTSCHVEQMTIERDRRVADVETVHDPDNGLFNRLFATAETRFVAIDDGADYPRLEPAGESFVVRNLYTDFKRHDLGPNFHEREYDGSFQTEFLTEALWGVGSTAPYGHDGRSINLEEVILRHGGEAQRSRDRFAQLRPSDQRKIIEFLETLVLFPPDDTASNLNPGDPDGYPQDPANHGSINLGALFQIEDEGPE